jgi:hypothetical protein
MQTKQNFYKMYFHFYGKVHYFECQILVGSVATEALEIQRNHVKILFCKNFVATLLPAVTTQKKRPSRASRGPSCRRGGEGRVGGWTTGSWLAESCESSCRRQLASSWLAEGCIGSCRRQLASSWLAEGCDSSCCRMLANSWGSGH